jgi:hypothetical protein
VAWTFDVLPHVFPDDVLNADVCAFAKGRRFRSPVAGEFPAWTRYLGSPRGSGDRLLRVYRKDLQQPELGVLAGGALLRVELVLRDEHAAALWPLYVDDPASAYAAAAAHVHHMTGCHVQSSITSVPSIDVPDDLDIAQGLLNFMGQYPGVLQQLLSAPDDVRGTLQRIASARQSASSRARATRRQHKFNLAGGWPVVLESLQRLAVSVSSNHPTAEVA